MDYVKGLAVIFSAMFDNNWFVAIFSGLAVSAIWTIGITIYNGKKKVYFSHEDRPMIMDGMNLGGLPIMLKVGDVEASSICLQTCMILNNTRKVITDQSFIQPPTILVPEPNRLVYHGVVNRGLASRPTLTVSDSSIVVSGIMLKPREGIIFRFATTGRGIHLPNAILPDQPSLELLEPGRPPLAVILLIWCSVIGLGGSIIFSGNLLIYSSLVAIISTSSLMFWWDKLARPGITKYFAALAIVGPESDVPELGQWAPGPVRARIEGSVRQPPGK